MQVTRVASIGRAERPASGAAKHLLFHPGSHPVPIAERRIATSPADARTSA
jgi:hypothetical protein